MTNFHRSELTIKSFTTHILNQPQSPLFSFMRFVAPFCSPFIIFQLPSISHPNKGDGRESWMKKRTKKKMKIKTSQILSFFSFGFLEFRVGEGAAEILGKFFVVICHPRHFSGLLLWPIFHKAQLNNNSRRVKRRKRNFLLTLLGSNFFCCPCCLFSFHNKYERNCDKFLFLYDTRKNVLFFFFFLFLFANLQHRNKRVIFVYIYEDFFFFLHSSFR